MSTSLRLLAVLNVLFKYASARRAARFDALGEKQAKSFPIIHPKTLLKRNEQHKDRSLRHREMENPVNLL